MNFFNLYKQSEGVYMKTKKRKKTHVSFRINWLFIVVFLLFSALILRLGFVQIVYGENYKREDEKTDVFGKSDKKKDKNTIKLTERDLKDYWIATNPKAAAKKITAADKQKVKEGQLSEDDLYPLQLKRITKNELLSVKDDLEV